MSISPLQKLINGAWKIKQHFAAAHEKKAKTAELHKEYDATIEGFTREQKLMVNLWCRAAMLGWPSHTPENTLVRVKTLMDRPYFKLAYAEPFTPEEAMDFSESLSFELRGYINHKNGENFSFGSDMNDIKPYI